MDRGWIAIRYEITPTESLDLSQPVNVQSLTGQLAQALSGRDLYSWYCDAGRNRVMAYGRPGKQEDLASLGVVTVGPALLGMDLPPLSGGGGSYGPKITVAAAGPGDASNGDIWIEDSFVPASIVFAASEPASPQQNDVWIKTGYVSPVNTDFSVGDGSGVRVAATKACRWNGAEWSRLAAYAWQDAQWARFSVAQGYVYSGSYDNTVRKISSSGSQVWSYAGHTSVVRAVVVDSSGYVYSGSDDRSVRKISPSGSQVWSYTGHTSYVYAVAVTPLGYVYSGSYDNTVRKISPAGAQVWSYTGHTSSVSAVAVDPGCCGAFYEYW